MPKFSFRRPRIISKKFPKVDSTIDGVTSSLHELVFSYTERLDKTLQKKHLMMGFSSLVLLLVLGSFISPRGKAEMSVFYPDTCLGGWVNPQYAEGEGETTSNGDPTQFTKHNSAVLPKNTDAEMYCGNFKGKFDTTTRPTKIVVSLAMTKGEDLVAEDVIESGLLATGTPAIVSSSTVDASSSPEALVLASSSASVDTGATSTVTGTTTSGTPVVSPQEPPSIMDGIIESVKDTFSSFFTATSTNDQGTTDTVVLPPPAPTTEPQETQSAPAQQETSPAPAPEAQESSPVPSAPAEPAPAPAAPAPEAPPAPSEPTSLLAPVRDSFLSLFFQKVFAQEAVSGASEPPVTPPDSSAVVETPPSAPVTTQETAPSSEPVVATPSSETSQGSQATSSTVSSQETPEEQLASSTTSENLSQGEASSPTSTSTETIPYSEVPQTASLLEALTGIATQVSSSEATSTSVVSTEENASSTATTTDASIASESNATTTDDNQFQNNFLEVFYSFDGVTWVSLGELNEISMKYRTFEIPVTATTSWSDMSKLQMKVVAKKHTVDTPTVYLDAIKVEVLFDSTQAHPHPDFARDTILKDETVNDMRIVHLINSENSQEEIWYMYLDDATSTETVATSSDIVASSTEGTTTLVVIPALTTQEIASTTSSSTESVATSSVVTPRIKPVSPKNVWMRFTAAKAEGLSGAALAELIRAIDDKKNESVLDDTPDFAVDVIKGIKGAFLNAVVVQLEKNGQEELWLYDLEKGAREKIDVGTSTSLAPDSPLGVKAGRIFWLSGDEATIYAYNITTKIIQEKPVPKYDPSQGERATVIFDDIPWKVIVGASGFSFFSDVTGEVFSDEDGGSAELLREKLNLDTFLTKEELSHLNLHVNEDSGTSTVPQ